LRKKPDFAAFGRRGGKKRMKGLSPDERRELARKGGAARADQLSPLQRSLISRLGNDARAERMRKLRWMSNAEAAKFCGMSLKQYMAEKRKRIIALRAGGLKGARIAGVLRKAIERLGKEPVRVRPARTGRDS
jgi:hypothetical protein